MRNKNKKNGILWDRRVEQREKSLSLFLFQILQIHNFWCDIAQQKPLYNDYINYHLSQGIHISSHKNHLLKLSLPIFFTFTDLQRQRVSFLCYILHRPNPLESPGRPPQVQTQAPSSSQTVRHHHHYTERNYSEPIKPFVIHELHSQKKK